LKRHTASLKAEIARHRPGAALVIPNTKRVATNRDLTTIIRSQHELNRGVFWN
jgi:hypothetical protein